MVILYGLENTFINMKYDLIKTENYLIIVDGSEIKEDEYYLSKISNDNVVYNLLYKSY